jgi:hypothetical protein
MVIVRETSGIDLTADQCAAALKPLRRATSIAWISAATTLALLWVQYLIGWLPPAGAQAAVENRMGAGTAAG